jgi:hypothetical protein
MQSETLHYKTEIMENHWTELERSEGSPERVELDRLLAWDDVKRNVRRGGAFELATSSDRRASSACFLGQYERAERFVYLAENYARAALESGRKPKKMPKSVSLEECFAHLHIVLNRCVWLKNGQQDSTLLEQVLLAFENTLSQRRLGWAAGDRRRGMSERCIGAAAILGDWNRAEPHWEALRKAYGVTKKFVDSDEDLHPVILWRREA